MINSDSSRLFRAIAISIVFHLFLFFLMNLFDWFPESENLSDYEPVTVRIIKNPEYSPQDKKVVSEEILPDETKPAMEDKSVFISDSPAKGEETSGNEVEIVPASIPDAYDDLFIREEVNAPAYVPPTDAVKEDKPFVPGENRIEFESIDNPEIIKNDAGSVQTPFGSSIVSESDITALEDSFSNSETYNYPDSDTPSDTENIRPRYLDDSFKFDRGDVKRELVSSPRPQFPNDLPWEFPSEIKFTIRFELNSDGVVKVLSITPPTVYPSVETSIRNALRSWMFNGSPGSDNVKGTITLIFKAK